MAHWEACPTPTIAAVTGGVGHPSLGWCDCSLSRGATMVNPNPVGMADMAEAFEYTAGPLMHWMTSSAPIRISKWPPRAQSAKGALSLTQGSSKMR